MVNITLVVFHVVVLAIEINDIQYSLYSRRIYKVELFYEL